MSRINNKTVLLNVLGVAILVADNICQTHVLPPIAEIIVLGVSNIIGRILSNRS